MNDFEWDKTPGRNTPIENLVRMVNASLTQGSSMTRGNLAWRYLLDRIFGPGGARQLCAEMDREWLAHYREFLSPEEQEDLAKEEKLTTMAVRLRQLMAQKEQDEALAEWEQDLIRAGQFIKSFQDYPWRDQQ